MRGRLDAVVEPPDLPGGIVLRCMNADDSDALGSLMLDAYRGTVDDHGEALEWHRTEAASTMSGRFGAVLWDASLLATSGADAIGACIVTQRWGRPLLAFALTRPEWQRRGIGTALIARSAARLREDCYKEWTLAVTDGNPARRLYERMGFVQDDTLRSDPRDA